MSMLAEKKTKPKWILDPKQNDWTRDSNKFGQRMLEKMGWTPGKGLGASEQGITTALRVKYKSDNRGLGCSDVKFESLVQQKKFEMLLSELNCENNSPDPGNKLSLEEKSKLTKKRVFYHKSIKGKDITRYSERDLQCIFGFEKNNSHQGNNEVDDNCVQNFQLNTDLNLECVNKKKRKLDSDNESNEVIDRSINSGEEAKNFPECNESNYAQNTQIKKKKTNRSEILLDNYSDHNVSDVQFSEETQVKSKVKCKENNSKSKIILYGRNEIYADMTGDEIENENAQSNCDTSNGRKKKKEKEKQNRVRIQNGILQLDSTEISLESERKKEKKWKDCTKDNIELQNADCEEVGNTQNFVKKKKKKHKECL